MEKKDFISTRDMVIGFLSLIILGSFIYPDIKAYLDKNLNRENEIEKLREEIRDIKEQSEEIETGEETSREILSTATKQDDVSDAVPNFEKIKYEKYNNERNIIFTEAQNIFNNMKTETLSGNKDSVTREGQKITLLEERLAKLEVPSNISFSGMLISDINLLKNYLERIGGQFGITSIIYAERDDFQRTWQKEVSEVEALKNNILDLQIQIKFEESKYFK